MGKILNRISQFIESEDISIGAFERNIKASKGVLSRAIANNTDIQAKWLEVIVENYPHISAEWLLRGKGEMLKKEDLEHEAGGNNANLASAILSLSQQISNLVEENRALREQLALSQGQPQTMAV